MDDFLVRAILAGFGVAVLAGPLGCFVIWQKMIYFGSTLAHAALLGIALGFLLDLSPLAGVLAVSALLAMALAFLQGRPRLSGDTLLGILSHAALALGLVVIALMEDLRVDLMSYLFGDILAVSSSDLVLIYAAGAVVLGALYALWRPMLSITVHEDLARVEGLNAEHLRLFLMLLVAVCVALALKIVGLLLITSLLIIPPAVAGVFARTPEGMALMASLIGMASVVVGIGGSLAADLPAGPAIVLSATVFFLISMMKRRRS